MVIKLLELAPKKEAIANSQSNSNHKLNKVT